MKHRLYRIVFLLATGIIFVPKIVFGAELILSADKKVFNTNDTFQVNLTLDTAGKNINALEGTIIFPSILELQEIRDGGSLINFWIDKPYASSSKVFFSGVTPNGYSNSKGFVLSLIFHGKQDGQGTIRLSNTRLLSNDGLGTEIPLKNSDFQFSVSYTNTPSNSNLQIHDSELPEIFKPEIVQDKNLASGKWVVVFTTDDKSSGMSSYQVREKKYSFFTFSKWYDAKSPYVLTDQNLNSRISVKAIDKAGNQRVVTLSPQNPILFYRNYDNLFIVAIVIIMYIYRKKIVEIFKKYSK